MTGAIPRILHQTWKDRDPPPRLRHFRDTWKRLHPAWEHRFWTDADLRRLVVAAAPHLLAVYDGYADPICRVDAARYLILHAIGGVYVDLDFECVRPIDPLLEGRRLVIGLEPDSHSALPLIATYGVSRLLCPSLIGSVPGHPFLRDVLGVLPHARHAATPLAATGPILLTRVHQRYRDPAPVTLIEPALLYPIDKEMCWAGGLFDIDRWDRATRTAYAIHHWDGTWFREADAAIDRPPRAAAVQVAASGQHRGPRGMMPLSYDVPAVFGDPPLVSCLLPADGDAASVMRAVACWQRQTWPARELLVLAAGDRRRWQDRLAPLGDPRMRVVDAASDAAEAAGAFVCHWRADELHDPLRIAIQMEAAARTRSDAVLLPRRLLWWPDQARLAASAPGTRLSTLLCRRAAGVPARIAHVDAARLSIVPMKPTDDASDRQWQAAAPRFEGVRYEALLATLRRRLPIEEEGG